jgi:hypothetical protein
LSNLPAAACSAAAHIRTVLNWAVKTRKLKHSPMAGANLPAKSGSRDRELSEEEARAVWAAAGGLPKPYGVFIRFLLGTGVRYTEAALATWDEFSSDYSEWRIPRHRMKGGRHKHVVPIPPILRELLRDPEQLPRFAGSKLVFTADGKRAITGSSALKKRLDKTLAGTITEPFVFHDFRRSAIGWLVRNGVDSLVADKLLAHVKGAKQSAVAAIYNKYEYLVERRDALERWTGCLIGDADLKLDVTAAPTPKTEPESENPSRQVHLLLMNPNDLAKAATADSDVLHRLIMMVMTDVEVIRACNGLLKFPLDPEFESDGYAAVFEHAAIKRVQLELVDPRPVLKQDAVDRDRTHWNKVESARRAKLEDARLQFEQAQAAAKAARDLGHEQYAREHDLEAQEAIAKMKVEEEAVATWRQMIATLPAADDPRVVKNLMGWSLTNPTARAQGVQVEMGNFFWKRFRRPCERAAEAFTNALPGAGVTVSVRKRQRSRLRAGAH